MKKPKNKRGRRLSRLIKRYWYLNDYLNVIFKKITAIDVLLLPGLTSCFDPEIMEYNRQLSLYISNITDKKLLKRLSLEEEMKNIVRKVNRFFRSYCRSPNLRFPNFPAPEGFIYVPTVNTSLGNFLEKIERV